MTGQRTTGRLLAVVGPSGVGKDSVMLGLAAACADIGIVRRVITRPALVGGENHIPITEARFAAQCRAGAFCLHWRAHGLGYGIPGTVLAEVACGAQLLVNLSRAVLPKAHALCPALEVLHITASPETLAARLAQRGRETGSEITDRLARANAPLPAGLPANLRIHSISNDGPLTDTVAQALRLLHPESV